MSRKSLVAQQADLEVEYHSKPNSRVTKAHIERMLDAMEFSQREDVPIAVRLGYLSFALANVLKEVGYPKHYETISTKMWENFGVKAE